MNRWYRISAVRRALAYILFSIIVLGIIIAFGIAPVKRETDGLLEKENLLGAEIEKQRIFQPLYHRLREVKMQEKTLQENLPYSTDAETKFFSIGRASSALSAMAAEAGMREIRFSPEPGSLMPESNDLLIEGAFQGNWVDFRHFLIPLATMPVFQGIESLSVQSTRSAPSYRLKIWISIDDAADEGYK